MTRGAADRRDVSEAGGGVRQVGQLDGSLVMMWWWCWWCCRPARAGLAQLAEVVGIRGPVAGPQVHVADVTGRQRGARREHDVLRGVHGEVGDGVVGPLPDVAIPARKT